MAEAKKTRHLLADDLERVLAQIDPLAQELYGSRLFITGGTGFFGKWLLLSLVSIADKLGPGSLSATVLTRDPDAFRATMPELAAHSALRFMKGDVRTFVFPTESFDYVIHAATDPNSTTNVEFPLVVLETIVEGTRNVLDFSRLCGARRVLFTSSGAVYGRQPEELLAVPESYLGAPDSLGTNAAYGQGKRLAETLCAAYSRAYGFDIVVARCWSFIGPFMQLDSQFAVANFIRDALNGRPIIVTGDGTATRSYLYGSDLAAWLLTLLLRGGSCRAYNVGSDESISIGALAHMVASCPAIEQISPVEVRVTRAANGIGPRERYVPAVDRARSELGLHTNISLSQAISKTVRWHQANGYVPRHREERLS